MLTGARLGDISLSSQEQFDAMADDIVNRPAKDLMYDAHRQSSAASCP